MGIIYSSTYTRNRLRCIQPSPILLTFQLVYKTGAGPTLRAIALKSVRKPKKSGTFVPHSKALRAALHRRLVARSALECAPKAALFLALAVFVGDLSAIALVPLWIRALLPVNLSKPRSYYTITSVSSPIAGGR